MKRFLLAIAVLLAACDNSQAFRNPKPTLARMNSQRRVDAPLMRAPAGTVAQEDDLDDAPPPVTRDLLVVGRARFETICATCHGIAGDGHSVVAEKMEHRRPPSLHEPRIRARSPEQIETTIRDGYGLMPGHADVLSKRERWAVVAYVRALQLSRRATVADLGDADRQALGSAP